MSSQNVKQQHWMSKFLQPKPVFRLCGAYACSLALLLGSGMYTVRAIEIFMPDGQGALGTHGVYWQQWQAVSCMFVSVINQLALGWTDSKVIGDILKADAFVFGIWGLMNSYIFFSPQHGHKFPMAFCVHSFLCVSCGMYAFAASKQWKS